MTNLPVTSYGRKVIGEKSRLMSFVLSLFFFSGFGIIYAGKLRKGIIFFITELIMLILIIFTSVRLSSIATMVEESINDPTAELVGLFGIVLPTMIICLIACLVVLILKITSIAIACHMCNENNLLWTNYLENN